MGMTPQPVVRRRSGRVWRKREVSFMDFDFNKIKEMGLEYACRRAPQDLPAVRCTRLGRCTVLQ